MKIQFIDDIKGTLKLFSVQLSALWAIIVGIIAADPMLFVTAWNAIPSELREFMPPWVRWCVAFSALFGTIYLARVVKQPATTAGKIAEQVRNITEMNPDLPPDQAKAIAARFVEQDAAAFAKKCDLPPPGWRCTRAKGHEGPCAAVGIAQ